MSHQVPTQKIKATPLRVINNIISVTTSVDRTKNIVNDIVTDKELHDLLMSNMPNGTFLRLFGLTPNDTISTGCKL